MPYSVYLQEQTNLRDLRASPSYKLIQRANLMTSFYIIEIPSNFWNQPPFPRSSI